MRFRIEMDLKAMYDKLCLSSLDKTYPQRLLLHIGASADNNARQINEHVNKLYVESMNKDTNLWRDYIEQADAQEVYNLMDAPLSRSPAEGHVFVEKSLAAAIPALTFFYQLTQRFERRRIFRKLQAFVGLCALYRRIDDERVKALCLDFFDLHKDADLPFFTQVECAFLRLCRKISVIFSYPELRQRLRQKLATVSELDRFIRPPSALSEMYPTEIKFNQYIFDHIKMLTDLQLKELLTRLLKIEEAIEEAFRAAYVKLPSSEQQIGGFESYGVGGKSYQFKNILISRNLEPR